MGKLKLDCRVLYYSAINFCNRFLLSKASLILNRFRFYVKETLQISRYEGNCILTNLFKAHGNLSKLINQKLTQRMVTLSARSNERQQTTLIHKKPFNLGISIDFHKTFRRCLINEFSFTSSSSSIYQHSFALLKSKLMKYEEM